MRPVVSLDELTAEEEWAADSGEDGLRPPHPALLNADPRNIPALLKELARTAPRKDRAMYREILAEAAPLIEYYERQPEIEAAIEALEPHWPAFDKLYEDRQAFTERARLLFTEERFAPLRFTAADVQHAFDKLGKPVDWRGPNEFEEKILAAILFVADKDRRSHLSLQLEMHLPRLLAEGRTLDACLVAEGARLTGEDFKHSNAFLFHMFAAGYEAWMAAQRRHDLAWLRDLGLDPDELEGKSATEIDAWLGQFTADPALAARLEQYLESHPEKRAEAMARSLEVQRNSVVLLLRREAEALLIRDVELDPWLPEFERVLSPFFELAKNAPEAELDEARQATMHDSLWPLLSRMSLAIFTPDRRQQLHDQLQALRGDLLDDGDVAGVQLAQGALQLLDCSDEPARLYLLNSICLKSYRRYASRLRNKRES